MPTSSDSLFAHDTLFTFRWYSEQHSELMPLAPRISRLAAHIFIIAALYGGASLELLAEECQAFGTKYKSAQDIMQAVLSELEKCNKRKPRLEGLLWTLLI
jgi:hypothetical protein